MRRNGEGLGSGGGDAFVGGGEELWATWAVVGAVVGDIRVDLTAHVRRTLKDAIDKAAGLAEEDGHFGEAIGSGGVLVTGSVVTVGEA